jgi:hypothetical protein
MPNNLQHSTAFNATKFTKKYQNYNKKRTNIHKQMHQNKPKIPSFAFTQPRRLNPLKHDIHASNTG